MAEFFLQTDRNALALTTLRMVPRHCSSNAATLQRTAQLFAQDGGVMAQDLAAQEVAGGEEAMDALVTRLLVELAIQHR